VLFYIFDLSTKQKSMKKILLGLLMLLAALFVLFLLGPEPELPQLQAGLPAVPTDPLILEQEIISREANNPLVKEDNEARIIWADSSKSKTPYSMVYLHGFGASQGEGEPVHRLLAERFGCNLYLSRLREQGIQSDSAFKSLTADNLLASAKEAVAIGKVLGDSVIIIGTSTGGALGLYVTANNPDIAGLLLYSPIIAPKNEALYLLNGPWGREIGEQVLGRVNVEEREGYVKKYWSDVYYLEGYMALASFVENAMVEETFRQVSSPVFLAYYYKNEEEQDQVVSVDAMLEMYDQLGTAGELKEKAAFPEAGNHVISSVYRSSDWLGVYEESANFLEEVMRLPVVSDTKVDSSQYQLAPAAMLR
jgi:pimeloyl-ACP methyl ester carboxylesterase